MTAAPATLYRPAPAHRRATARDAWRPDAARTRHEAVVLRAASAADAGAIEALVSSHAAEARMLPRSVAEIAAHADRFVVAVRGGVLVACGALALLGGRTAEVRSLVVDPSARALGVGDRVLEALAARARAAGGTRLCAFTHAPAWFVRRGFAIVPHAWVPEKIAADCRACDGFRRCGQVAVVRTLDREPPRTEGSRP